MVEDKGYSETWLSGALESDLWREELTSTQGTLSFRREQSWSKVLLELQPKASTADDEGQCREFHKWKHLLECCIYR